MTMLMQDEVSENPPAERTSKLRFATFRDYWAFATKVAGSSIDRDEELEGRNWPGM